MRAYARIATKPFGDATLNQFTENHLWLTIGYGRGNPRDARRAPTFGVDAPNPAGN